jgi:hypothetical protein
MMLIAASAFAQGKPNFAGKWTVDAEKTTAAGGRGGGAGVTTITMDATTLTLEREGRNGGAPTKTVYKLDGSESKNMQAGRGGGEPTEVVSTAKIDGAKVVITTKGANGDQVSSWYMDGEWLVSERAGQNGPQKTYYKKG